MRGRSNLSLFLLAFLAVFREGIELALFLVAATFATSARPDGHRRARWGWLLAAGLGYLMFRGATAAQRSAVLPDHQPAADRLRRGHGGVRRRTNWSRPGVVPALVDPLYNINPVLSDQAGWASLLKTLFGYNGNPALIETMA